jgi:hypothetical protein
MPTMRERGPFPKHAAPRSAVSRKGDLILVCEAKTLRAQPAFVGSNRDVVHDDRENNYDA